MSEHPLTLAEAVEDGDYLEILYAQRRHMVADIAVATGPALAALHRQIALHSKEIAALELVTAEERATAARADASDEAFNPDAI